MFGRFSRIAWRNPSGTVTLSHRVHRDYLAVFQEWQRLWYETWPNLDSDPKWYARPNPEPALGYPPGFLKRQLDVLVIYTASSPDVDGFFWANDRVITDVDSYEALDSVLESLTSPVEMLILTGECLNVPGDACGVCWREINDVGFSSTMPASTAALLHSRIQENGIFVLGSCHSGENPGLVAEMADLIRRPVAGARGVCRGVRDRLLVEDGIYWTLGGFAEDRAYTLAEPSV